MVVLDQEENICGMADPLDPSGYGVVSSFSCLFLLQEEETTIYSYKLYQTLSFYFVLFCCCFQLRALTPVVAT